MASTSAAVSPQEGDDVGDLVAHREVAERGGERQGEQEGEQDADPGEHDPQLVGQLVEPAVQVLPVAVVAALPTHGVTLARPRAVDQSPSEGSLPGDLQMNRAHRRAAAVGSSRSPGPCSHRSAGSVVSGGTEAASTSSVTGSDQRSRRAASSVTPR